MRYRESSDYLALAPATRRQRDNIFENVVERLKKLIRVQTDV
jgi:hypothetical protein